MLTCRLQLVREGAVSAEELALSIQVEADNTHSGWTVSTGGKAG